MESHRYPEWKRLIDEIIPLITNGQKLFSYEDLSQMAGCDIRKKRQQFYRLRLELRETKNLWLENIRNYGYEIIEPKLHVLSANKMVTGARRRIREANAIAIHTPLDKLTESQLHQLVSVTSLISTIASVIELNAKKLISNVNQNKGNVPKEVTENIHMVKEST